MIVEDYKAFCNAQLSHEHAKDPPSKLFTIWTLALKNAHQP
jgi:hypothetical protein